MTDEICRICGRHINSDEGLWNMGDDINPICNECGTEAAAIAETNNYT